MCVLLSDVVRTVSYHVLRSYIGEQSACSAGGARDAESILGLGRFPGGGNGNLLQYSCLGDPINRGAWQATVHGVTKGRI